MTPTPETIQLLPCPFCGVELIPNNNHNDLSVRRYGTHYAHPSNDCCLSELEITPQELIGWNTRTLSPETIRDEDWEDTLDRIEQEVGMSHYGWDLVDPKELVASVLKHTRTPTPETIAAVIEHLEKEGYVLCRREPVFFMQADPDGNLLVAEIRRPGWECRLDANDKAMGWSEVALYAAAPPYTPQAAKVSEKGGST